MKKTECACGECQRACRNTPGWFRPGEAEQAAKLLGLPLRRFFKKYLGVNWYNTPRGEVFVLAPAMLRMSPGEEYPGNPKGQCVFLQDDGRCRIHAAKPYHCSHGNPCTFDEKGFNGDIKRSVALWKKEQGQIRTLLGRKPKSEPLSMWDCIFNIF